MVHFICGIPGTGKTNFMLHELERLIKEQQTGIFYIVPEQMMYAAELSILPSLEPKAPQYLQISSFTRLTQLILMTYGGLSSVKMTKQSEAVLMWRSVRELQSTLDVYKPRVDEGYTGICQTLLTTYSQMKAASVRTCDIEKVQNDFPRDTVLYKKLKDVSAIYSYYDSLVETYCTSNPLDMMTLATEKADDNGFFNGKTVFVDSFFGFSKNEYNLLTVILRDANNVYITLPFNPNAKRCAVNDGIRHCYDTLNLICQDLDVKTYLNTDFLIPRTESPALKLITESLFDFTVKGPTSAGANASDGSDNRDCDNASDNVTIIKAQTRKEEADAAALHIVDLHRKNVPYNRIFLCVRSLSEWSGYLNSSFERFHIPAYISEKTPLSQQSVARLILQALVCIKNGMNYTDLISYSKTGLFGLDTPTLDSFQKYLETWKISGNSLVKGDFTVNADGITHDFSQRGESILKNANTAREVIISPLWRLNLNLKQSKTLTEQCGAIYRFICETGAPGHLREKAQTYLDMGKKREAGILTRLWSFVTQILVELPGMFAPDDKSLSIQELYTVLSMSFDSTDIASVPSSFDCVTVGQADMFRPQQVHTMLVLGCNEGEFPKLRQTGGVFSQDEKITLEKAGLQTGQSVELAVPEELWHFYHAVTRPSNNLLLFYHEKDDSNAVSYPSVALSSVKRLLPNIRIRSYNAAYTDALTDNTTVTLGNAVAAEQLLFPETLERLLKNGLSLSQSKLSSLAACPYRFFSESELCLRKDTVAEINHSVSGTFIHTVLEQYFSQDSQRANKQDPRLFVSDFTKDFWDSYFKNGEPDYRVAHTLRKLESLSCTMLEGAKKEIDNSGFQVFRTELSSSARGGRLVIQPYSYAFPISSYSDAAFTQPFNVRLSGIIDRVDVLRDNDTVYVRIVDYKSSEHSFSPEKIRETKDIQILLYLFTLLNPENISLFKDQSGNQPKEILPAEAYYCYPAANKKANGLSVVRNGLILNNPTVLSAAEPDRNNPLIKNLTFKDGAPQGAALYTQDQIKGLKDIMLESVNDAVSRLLTRKINRNNENGGCAFCNLSATCPMAKKDRIGG